MHRNLVACLLLALAIATTATPAAADHTDPSQPQASTEGATTNGYSPSSDQGAWEHLGHIAGNPGTDLEFFTKDGVTYATTGTLGQGSEQHVGQRIVELIDAEGNVTLEVVADHGSAVCMTATGVTGLQHDPQVTPDNLQHGEPELILDATDASGRCHDTPSGGLEIIDISGLGEEGFEVRELHLTRHDGTSHTVTVDATRPHIAYTNPSSFGGLPFIEFVDLSSCLGLQDLTLEDKRAACRPEAYRIPFQPEWSAPVDVEEPTPADAADCHDITVTPGRVYCAGLAATLVFDVSGITNADGSVNGTPLPCEVVEGTATGAMVTDCQVGTWDDYVELGAPQADGWEFLGSIRHVARDCGGGTTNCNSNFVVPSDEGIAVAHESDPTPDGRFVFVTDERGGGVVPGGATCTTGIDNPYGNGGVHVYDISDPANPEPALAPDGERAVFITPNIVTSPTFCTSHVMELLPGEQRFIIAWYSQGTKLVDFDIDEDGAWTFTEVASITLPGAQTWAAEPFRTVDNPDGSRTYYILATDIGRGIDVMSWTGPPGPPLEDVAPGDQVQVERIGGDGAVATAVAVSAATREAAETVVIGRDDVYADSLAGGPLAATLDAPLLYSRTVALSEPTAAEIERLGATRAVLLGGTAALSEQVADDLRALGVEVERLGGENRFGTAALVAARVGSATGSVFVAEGEHVEPQRGWPDPIAAAPYAAFRRDPVLLVNRDRLPRETADALAALDSSEAVVVGGTAAVSDAVEAEIEATGVATRRLAGETRYATSQAVVAEAVAEGMDPSTLWFATGSGWGDALAAGPAAAAAGQPLALLDGLGGSDTREAILATYREGLERVLLVGGEDAITPEVEDDVRRLVGAPPRAAGTTQDEPPQAASLAPVGFDGPAGGDAATLLAALVALCAASVLRRRRLRVQPTAS